MNKIWILKEDLDLPESGKYPAHTTFDVLVNTRSYVKLQHASDMPIVIIRRTVVGEAALLKFNHMLNLRDIPQHLTEKLKDANTEGHLTREKVWKNSPSPRREEVYRQAFQDGIRAALNILPIGSMGDDYNDAEHPEAAEKCAHGIPKSVDCTKCKQDESERQHIEQRQPDYRSPEDTGSDQQL